MDEQYNGGGVETVMSEEDQSLKSEPWQKGYTQGITFGYDSLEDENPYVGQDATEWDRGRSLGLADIYKME